MDYSCARAPFLETLDDDACVYVVWTALSILTRRTQGSQLPHTETALNTAKQAIQDGMQKFLWMYLLFKSLVQLKRNAIPSIGIDFLLLAGTTATPHSFIAT